MTPLHPPARVAVIGAGTMGVGIALVFARAGSDVRLMARRRSSLAAARDQLTKRLNLLLEGGVATPADASVALASIATTTSFEDAVANADLVVESVVEDLTTKREVLTRAERTAPEALLATDTSSLSIVELAEPLQRPEVFAGFHWFNPPELVPLVEVVSGPRTSAETALRLIEWARAVGQRPVHVQRDIEGFVANRLQYALFREAFALVEAGVCGFAEVDEAVTAGLGYRWAAVGPFESLDLAGLDVHEAVARRLYPTLACSTEPAKVVRELVAQDALGCKTGRGLYGVYDDATVDRLIRRRTRTLLVLGGLDRDAEGHSNKAVG